MVYRRACIPATGESWFISANVDWIGSTTGMTLNGGVAVYTANSTGTPLAKLVFDGIQYQWIHRDGAGSTSGNLASPTPATNDTIGILVTRATTTTWDFSFVINGTTALAHTGHTYDPLTETEALWGMNVNQNSTINGMLFDRFDIA